MGLYDNLFFKRGNFIQAETVLGMLLDGYLIDARAGGLVIGKSHEEGHIYMIQRDENDAFEFINVMEGGEYILCHEACDAALERLEVINQDTGPVTEFVVPDIYHRATRVINTNATPDDKILLIDARGQFIINAVSTRKHFNELQALNDRYAFKSHFCMKDFFVRKPPLPDCE